MATDRSHESAHEDTMDNTGATSKATTPWHDAMGLDFHCGHRPLGRLADGT